MRFRTNFKLALHGVDQQTQDTVYLGNLQDMEYHFVRFEGSIPPLELSLSSLQEKLQKAIIPQADDWTVTDFDNCLDGNPHVVYD